MGELSPMRTYLYQSLGYRQRRAGIFTSRNSLARLRAIVGFTKVRKNICSQIWVSSFLGLMSGAVFPNLRSMSDRSLLVLKFGGAT